MNDITPNQFTILERLAKGPEWIRSFQPAKPLLDDLIGKGFVERCRPFLGRARNMVRLTAAGCDLLEVDAAEVPAKRDKPALIEKQRLKLGAIRPGLSDKVRLVCERFVVAIESGRSPTEIVTELAARDDVQRPAIWRRLRSGGVLPDYRPRCDGGKGRPLGGGVPGFTSERRRKALMASAKCEPPSEQYVDRDPCQFCGVRADVGCRHNRHLEAAA